MFFVEAIRRADVDEVDVLTRTEPLGRRVRLRIGEVLLEVAQDFRVDVRRPRYLEARIVRELADHARGGAAKADETYPNNSLITIPLSHSSPPACCKGPWYSLPFRSERE